MTDINLLKNRNLTPLVSKLRKTVDLTQVTSFPPDDILVFDEEREEKMLADETNKGKQVK